MGVKGLIQVKCSCLNCRDVVAVKQLSRHYDRCIVKGGKHVGRKYPKPASLHCQHCQQERKNENSLRQHEIRCSSNPNAIPISPSFGVRGKKGTNQFTKARNLGLPIPKISNATKEKMFETRKKNGTLNKTDEQKKNLSIAMKKAVEKYPESYTSANRGRTKQIVIDGIKLQGQWEVDFYLWAKEQGLNPQRPTKGFKYIWNGERTYYPDFYIESLNLYVEVKGYETDRDRAKWLHFPEKLRIIKEKEIKEIRKGCFVGP
jgi:hypothetical protein